MSLISDEGLKFQINCVDKLLAQLDIVQRDTQTLRDYALRETVMDALGTARGALQEERTKIQCQLDHRDRTE